MYLFQDPNIVISIHSVEPRTYCQMRQIGAKLQGVTTQNIDLHRFVQTRICFVPGQVRSKLQGSRNRDFKCLIAKLNAKLITKTRTS